MNKIEKFTAEYSRLYQELENGNFEVEHDVYSLEHSLQEELTYSFGNEGEKFQKLLNKIKKMKKEFDFYDQEVELDRMFPDRHDDDFDEESMNYDSVFGDD
ncbi:hypothetical protein EV144_1011431 [Flavobacterium sp. 270]|uniref:hypothetical protein n=1 Tax=Flavobacterium sp. 270 TaxID=2512114 RepID=UPI0010654253|nr:hypothetical protein [Flavobacterium sp. 270]TDW52738.1 hypothetical protein EV144_1011431 [Flavobacterium sp. 270]